MNFVPAATLKMLFDDHLSAQLADSERSTVNDLLEHLNSVMDDMQLVREPDRLAQATQTKVNLARLCRLPSTWRIDLSKTRNSRSSSCLLGEKSRSIAKTSPSADHH